MRCRNNARSKAHGVWSTSPLPWGEGEREGGGGEGLRDVLRLIASKSLISCLAVCKIVLPRKEKIMSFDIPTSDCDIHLSYLGIIRGVRQASVQAPVARAHDWYVEVN